MVRNMPLWAGERREMELCDKCRWSGTTCNTWQERDEDGNIIRCGSFELREYESPWKYSGKAKPADPPATEKH